MAELTIAQKKAIVLAKARLRLKQSQQPQGGGWDRFKDDVAQTASGLGEGAIGLAGTIGDVQGLANSGVGWALNKMGVPQETTDAAIAGAEKVNGRYPRSSELIQGAQDMGVPFAGEAQHEEGRWLRRGGQMLPGAAIGPGSLAVKAGSLLGSTVGAEGGGRIAEAIEPSWKPYGEVIGAVGGGGLGTALRQAPKVAPRTTGELQQAKNAAYATAEQSGARLSPDQYLGVVADVARKAVKEGMNRRNSPDAYGGLKELASKLGHSPTVKEMDILRRQLKMGSNIFKPEERRLISQMVKQFDESLDTVAPNVSSAYGEARNLNREYKRNEFVDKLNNRIELKASKYTQSGMENAIRDRHYALATSEREQIKQGLKKNEIEAIEGVAKGSNTANLLRAGGKFAPTSAVSAIPALLAGVVHAPLGVGVAAAGTASKMAGTALTKHGAKMVEVLLRGGEKGLKDYKTAVGRQRLEAMVRALLQGQGSQSHGLEVDIPGYRPDKTSLPVGP